MKTRKEACKDCGTKDLHEDAIYCNSCFAKRIEEKTMKLPKNFKMDSEGPRHVHECEDCKPLPFDKILGVKPQHTPTPEQKLNRALNKYRQNEITDEEMIVARKEFEMHKNIPNRPVPWVLKGKLISSNEEVIINLDDTLLTFTDAAFIVRAVNNFDALLEAAKWALMAAQTGEKIGPSVKRSLEEAIAKAEGKTHG